MPIPHSLQAAPKRGEGERGIHTDPRRTPTDGDHRERRALTHAHTATSPRVSNAAGALVWTVTAYLFVFFFPGSSRAFPIIVRGDRQRPLSGKEARDGSRCLVTPYGPRGYLNDTSSSQWKNTCQCHNAVPRSTCVRCDVHLSFTSRVLPLDLTGGGEDYRPRRRTVGDASVFVCNQRFSLACDAPEH